MPTVARLRRTWRDDLARLRADVGAETAPAMTEARLAAAVAAAQRALPRRWSRRRPAWRVVGSLAAVLALVVLWNLRPSSGPEGMNGAVAAGALWPQLQRTFGGCLEEPVPVDSWQEGGGAGVVTILAPNAAGDGYEVAACLEAADLSRLRRYPWAEQRLRQWGGSPERPLLVTVCRTGDDRAARRQLRRAVLANFPTGG